MNITQVGLLANFDSHNLILFVYFFSFGKYLIENYSLSGQGVGADEVSDGQDYNQANDQTDEVVPETKFFEQAGVWHF